MEVYLDNNILIDLEEGIISVKEIEDAISSKIETIYYSAAHIQEALEIKGENESIRQERINKRLRTISKITKNNYINQNLDNTLYRIIETPFEVMKTIQEVPFAQGIMKNFVNFISEGQKKNIRETLNIDPRRVNNYKPEEVIKQFNNKIEETGQGFNFLDLIEKGISYFPNKESFGISHRITAIFELLDMLGYWKDKYNSKSNYARLWDSSHAFYAAHFDLFLTNDTRTINKSKVAYNLYNIKTEVKSV